MRISLSGCRGAARRGRVCACAVAVVAAVRERGVGGVLATSLSTTLDDTCSMMRSEVSLRTARRLCVPAIRGASLPSLAERRAGARTTLVLAWMSCAIAQGRYNLPADRVISLAWHSRCTGRFRRQSAKRAVSLDLVDFLPTAAILTSSPIISSMMSSRLTTPNAPPGSPGVCRCVR